MTKASSWTDAVAKAKSYIVVYVEYPYSISGVDYNFAEVFTLPKDKIIANTTYSCQGYYLSSSSYGLTQLAFSLTNCSAKCFHGSNIEILSKTLAYYYD